jgi:hypothetical protein
MTGVRLLDFRKMQKLAHKVRVLNECCSRRLVPRKTEMEMLHKPFRKSNQKNHCSCNPHAKGVPIFERFFSLFQKEYWVKACTLVEEVRTELLKSPITPYIPNLLALAK